MLRSCLSAAAPLPLDVAAFFAGLGMKILDVYGMTETTGAFTSNTTAAFRLGTVGRAVAGTQITIAEDGEILTRGPLNTPGYLNRPERTADLIDADGWLHTGDIGALDADGFLSVVDRKKELIITSGGENISPAAIENLLVAHPLIGQALAYGNNRRFVVALLTLDGEVAPAWARARGIDGSLAELAEHPTVLAAVSEAVSGGQRQAGARAAGQDVAAAAGGMDRRERGADAHPQAQAPGGARQVRGHHRLAVRGLISAGPAGRSLRAAAPRPVGSAAEASGCLVAPPVFKTGGRRAAPSAGSIPVRLRYLRNTAPGRAGPVAVDAVSMIELLFAGTWPARAVSTLPSASPCARQAPP